MSTSTTRTVFGDTSTNDSINIESANINESTEEKLLGGVFDQNLNFVTRLIRSYILSLISNFLETEDMKQISKAFVLSYFSYCPLLWMFCARTLNNTISHIHERTLGISYKVMRSDCYTILLRINSVPLHR